MNFLYFLLPSCWTCKYHLPHPHFSDRDKCALNRCWDTTNTTGSAPGFTTGLAKEARQDENKCGLRGSWHAKTPYL